MILQKSRRKWLLGVERHKLFKEGFCDDGPRHGRSASQFGQDFFVGAELGVWHADAA